MQEDFPWLIETDLRELRHFKTLAVLAGDDFVGVLVFEFFRFGIEIERTAQAVRGVANVAVRARKMGIHRGDGKVFLFA